jgi:DNA-directed RNA polymerase subunit beta'
MIKGKLGDVLINSTMPQDYRLEGHLDLKKLKGNLVKLAKNNPEQYKYVAPKIKKLGDEFSTYESITVGLDDIEPDYEERDKILNEAQKTVDKFGTKSPQAFDAFMKAQEQVMDLTKRHKGDMAMTARSGSRGNTTQLMKIIATPVVVGDFNGNPVPYLIKRSYSEGLSPAEAWIAGDESRSQVIKGQLGTAEPGEMQKVLSSVMSQAVVAEPDCGTNNGIRLKSDDPSLEGRYIASSGELINSQKAAQLSQRGGVVLVRSPMTCELEKGVCQKCSGTSVKGSNYEVGTSLGLRAAQALSEPLTQMQLSAKHGVSLVKGDSNKPRGLKAFKQFVEVPKNFFYKATLADTTGKVSGIAKAPQGGFDVTINNKLHYVPPGRDLHIKEGDEVEAGDQLCGGVAAPDEVLKYKGMGAGREYLVKSIRGAFEESGIKVDQRNIEVLAKTQLSYVKMDKKFGDIEEGEVVPISSVVKQFSNNSFKSNVMSSVGKVLAKPMFEHIPGTVITKRVAEDIMDKGATEVHVSDSKPVFSPIMVAATRTPLLNPNWLQRLGYRYQKDTLIDAATFGQKADIHGYDPLASLAVGKEFKRGPKGEY